MDTVWRQALRSEVAHSSSDSACTVLWDMKAFYEHVNLEKLRIRGLALGFSEAIMVVAVNMYMSARRVCMQGVYSAAVYASRGIPAGCTFATTFVKIYMLQLFWRRSWCKEALVGRDDRPTRDDSGGHG